MDGNQLAESHDPLTHGINYQDQDTCEGVCRHTTSPDVLAFYDKLMSSLLSSLRAVGRKCHQLVDDDLLLCFELYWAGDVSKVIWAMASGSFGASGRQTTDTFLWTQMHLVHDDVAFLDSRDFKGLLLRHARHTYLQMMEGCEPRAPFGSTTSGVLRDSDTTRLIGTIVSTTCRPGFPQNSNPTGCKISRVLHSSKLHETEPMDIYITDGLCPEWQVVMENRVGVSVGPAASPAPVAAAAAPAAARNNSMFLTNAKNSVKKSDRAHPPPSAADEGPSMYKMLLENKMHDLDSSLAKDFQEALSFLAAEEDKELGAADPVGSDCDVASQSDEASACSSSSGESLDDVHFDEQKPSKKRIAGDPSTYGVESFKCGDFGVINWSFGRECVSAHCGNPLHQMGPNKCRMTRVSWKRAAGAQGAWLLSAFDVSTKKEHMRMSSKKVFSRESRYCGRAFLKTHIPDRVWRNPKFQRKQKPGEDEEPVAHQ